MTYLEVLAKHIVTSQGSNLSETCFVFPNRRSGLFFRRYLLQVAEGTFWAPKIVTINELMQEISEQQLSDPLDLLFSIYDIYTNISTSPEPFDTFYPWAEMMMSDFDTLDKYLVDPVSIFKNIGDLKEIDEKFGGLDEEQVAYIRKFWKSFFIGEMTNEKDAFLSTWKILPRIYEELHKQLKDANQAYEGMIYRAVAEMDVVDIDARLDKKHYTFIGFNALSLSEKRFFAKLNMKGIASFYWDYDQLYVNDRSMEAGRFMRDNLESFPPPEDLQIHNNLEQLSDIRIFDLPSDVLQAKTIHKILEDRGDKIESATDTAIVACDENLLMPILVSLPETVDEVNITMGYPFRNTPLNSFIESVLRLLNNRRSGKSGNVQFYHKDVLSILNHQYFHLMTHGSQSEIIQSIISENQVYIHPADFTDDFSKLIFQKVETSEQFCTYLEALLHYLLTQLQDDDNGRQNELEREYIYLVLSRLNKISERIYGRENVELSTFIKLFRRMISNQRVPFTGEPLAGLQVMGILETRVLDFDHVIMLSLNEDVMPRSSAGHSFIPYSLRYAYNLPTREEMDAIYAYYFFRLLQRSKKVDLLFNSASDGVKNGEMSRYLYQLKYNFGAEIIRPVMSVKALEKGAVIINKVPELMQTLEKYYVGNEDKRYLSPSALNSYVECSLKFYFQRVAGISLEDELLEELDAIGFGNILHNTIYELYEEITKGEGRLTKEHLDALLKGNHLKDVLLKVFSNEYFKSNKNRALEGKNLIIFEIIKKYIYKIIKIDKDLAPFEILGLEKEFDSVLSVPSHSGTINIAIGGKIDRIDKVNGKIRIIDYKTGDAKMEFNSIEALFDSDEKNRNKEAFQAFMYAYLHSESSPEVMAQPGLYVTRTMFGEKFSPAFSMGEPRKRLPVDSFMEHKEEFTERLTALISEIYNPEIPFTQTDILTRCKYCEFKLICQR